MNISGRLAMSLFVLLSIAHLLPEAAGQQAAPEPPRRPLAISGEPRATSVSAGSMFGPIWCDDSGRVYFRVAQPLSQLLSAPITRIAEDGKVTVFDITNPPRVQYQDAKSFAAAVEPTGRVHALVNLLIDADTEKQLLVHFASDGSFVSSVPFDPGLRPYHLLALPEQRFFISGIRVSKPTADKSAKHGASFTGIFDQDGKMVRDLKSKLDDRQIRNPQSPYEAFNPAIQNGAASVGPDGSIYFLNGLQPPRVQVFSSTGSNQREFTLWLPFQNAEAGDLYVTPGRFVVRFQVIERPNVKRQSALVVYNSETGEPSIVYSALDLKGQVGCVREGGVTVLRVSPSGHYAIQQAEFGR